MGLVIVVVVVVFNGVENLAAASEFIHFKKFY